MSKKHKSFKFKSRGISARRVGDYLDVRIFSNGMISFKGGCPINDRAKVADLIAVLRAKGVEVPDRSSGWWK